MNINYVYFWKQNHELSIIFLFYLDTWDKFIWAQFLLFCSFFLKLIPASYFPSKKKIFFQITEVQDFCKNYIEMRFSNFPAHYVALKISTGQSLRIKREFIHFFGDELLRSKYTTFITDRVNTKSNLAIFFSKSTLKYFSKLHTSFNIIQIKCF